MYVDNGFKYSNAFSCVYTIDDADIVGLIKLSKKYFSVSFKSLPKINSYISLSLSTPNALNNINNGIFFPFIPLNVHNILFFLSI